ncbi:MAG: response regulator [Blastocatellia bacterium]|nr:response regulator [Blastocatellia bacterium]
MATILFVDDDETFLDTVTKLFSLKSVGLVEIKAVRNVGHALKVLQSEPIDMVVTDIKMPSVDGLQFLRLLQRKQPDLKKVVLTGFPEESYRSACLESGALLFAKKPVSADDLHSLYDSISSLVGIASKVETSDEIAIQNLLSCFKTKDIQAQENTLEEQPVLTDVNELVVSSIEGTLLLSYQSTEPELRIDFLDFVCLKGKQISELLGAGDFIRLGVEGKAFKGVAEIKENVKIFAGSNQQKQDCPEISQELAKYLSQKFSFNVK